MQGSLTVEQRRERIAAARQALTGIDGVAVAGARVVAGSRTLLGEVDALGAACEAAKVAIVGEAMERGETADGSAAMTVTQWVRHHAPSTRAGGAGQLVAVAQAFGKPANAPVDQAVRTGRAAGPLGGGGARRGGPVAAAAGRRAEPHVLAGLIAMAVGARAAGLPDGASGAAGEVRPGR